MTSLNCPALVSEQVDAYLAGGVPLLWLIDAWARRLTVHATDQPVRTLGEGDELEGGESLPGFRLPIAELFR